MLFRLIVALGLTTTMGSANALAGRQQSVAPGFPLPLEVSASTVHAINQMGHSVLVYELELTNPTSETFWIEELRISTESGVELRSIRPGQWQSLARGVPSAPDGWTDADALLLPPGQRWLVYLWIDVDGDVPRQLYHTLEASVRESSQVERWTVEGPTVDVIADLLVIDPPVRGGRWLVGNGLANDTDHRRFFVVGGSLMIPQRFGADFLKLATDGGNSTDGSTELEAFHSFGEPLYAVANGTVVKVLDGLDNAVVGEPRNGLEWETMPGNHVLLRIGENAYAVYAHLEKGSIRVEEGQTVRRGEVIGVLGNSGNSSAPHLHFHLSDRPHANSANGVPFAFSSFEMLVAGYEFRPDQRPLAERGVRHERTLPSLKMVVRFPERGR